MGEPRLNRIAPMRMAQGKPKIIDSFRITAAACRHLSKSFTSVFELFC
jgi:hypothetical protein